MRLHITLEDDLVADLDQLVGPGKRNAFITTAVRKAIEESKRWEGILDSLGSLPPEGGGEWGDDPETWVREERRSEPGRVG